MYKHTSNLDFEKPPKPQLTNGTSLTNLNKFEQKSTTTSSLLANRIIAPSRKITREMSDYEKSLNQRVQQTNDIIESM